MFLDEAIQLGLRIVQSSVRDAGRCTWFADDFIARDGFWQRTGGVLGPDFATGTAGVGWFLSKLSSAADDAHMRVVAGEALRQSLAAAAGLIDKRHFGFHEGAMGVAWAAVDGGRELNSAELLEQGIATARSAITAAMPDTEVEAPSGLWNGRAGTVAGVLGIPELSGEHDVMTIAAHLVDQLLERAHSRPADGRGELGLAYGASGVGLVLANCPFVFSQPSLDFGHAVEAFQIERAWLSPGRHWHGATAHAWLDEWTVPHSLCAGAAGIGISRLSAFAATRAPHLLAEAAAAIEIIRGAARRNSADDSLCHGTAGYIELLLTAWESLGEQSHLDAARRLGSRMIATARARGRYRSGLGVACGSPSLFLGTAGTALVFLRLHDPSLAPCAALPTAAGRVLNKDVPG